MRTLKFLKLIVPTVCLVAIATVVYGQGFADTNFNDIAQWVLGLITYVFAEIGKRVPAWKDLPLPTAVKVVAQSAAVALLFVFQGWGGIFENIIAILTTMGVFDLLNGLVNKKKPEVPATA